MNYFPAVHLLIYSSNNSSYFYNILYSGIVTVFEKAATTFDNSVLNESHLSAANSISSNS